MITWMPRPSAADAYSAISAGVRCAETTRHSCGTPNAVSTSSAWRIVSQSDLLPMITATSGRSSVMRAFYCQGRRGTSAACRDRPGSNQPVSRETTGQASGPPASRCTRMTLVRSRRQCVPLTPPRVLRPGSRNRKPHDRDDHHADDVVPEERDLRDSGTRRTPPRSCRRSGRRTRRCRSHASCRSRARRRRAATRRRTIRSD